MHGAALQAAAPTLPSLSPTQVQYIHGVFSALRPGVSLFCLHGRQKQMKRSAPTTHDPAHAPTLASAADPNAAHAPALPIIIVFLSPGSQALLASAARAYTPHGSWHCPSLDMP